MTRAAHPAIVNALTVDVEDYFQVQALAVHPSCHLGWHAATGRS